MVCFTHSAADLQWPEIARLFCPGNAGDKSARSCALIDNLAITDSFSVNASSSSSTTFTKTFWELPTLAQV